MIPADADSAELGVIPPLLERALASDRPALIEACRRLQTPIHAATLHQGASYEDAPEMVETVLRRFIQRLLEGHIKPAAWKPEFFQQVEAVVTMSGERESAIAGLTGMSAIPRLAKRRAVRDSLRELSLPELTAVMMRRLDKSTVDEMVGILADSREQAIEILSSAQEKLLQSMLAASDAANKTT